MLHAARLSFTTRFHLLRTMSFNDRVDIKSTQQETKGREELSPELLRPLQPTLSD